MDLLLSHATAATRPSGQSTIAGDPASPFVPPPDDSREGTLTLSDGKVLRGRFGHTERKPVRIWVEEEAQYRDVPFGSVRSMEARVIWEREEKEWRFRESGSDVKEYSGRTYPARETEYVVTLRDGREIKGGVAEPLYLMTPEGQTLFALHKRDKGEAGQTLKQLVYVSRVDFAEAPTSTTAPVVQK